MGRPAGGIDGATSRDQRLADHLPTEYALPAHLRRAAAKQVHFQLLEVENVEEIFNGCRHERPVPENAARGIIVSGAGTTQCYSLAPKESRLWRNPARPPDMWMCWSPAPGLWVLSRRSHCVRV
jgi:hypothetical protein